MNRLFGIPHPDILVHQSAIDYFNITHSTFVDKPIDRSHNDEEKAALEAAEEVISLKDKVGTLPDRAIDLVDPTDLSSIDSKRLPTLQIARELGHASAKRGSLVAWHGLADVHDFVTNYGVDLSRSNQVVRRGGEAALTFVQLEEGLVLQAERIATQASTSFTPEVATAGLVNDPLRPYHGYTFNRSGSRVEFPSIDLPNFPSCEAFMAATVLDQLRTSDAVLRVMPFWMRDREKATRDLIKLLAGGDVPVLSVIVGENGDIDKTIPWSENAPVQLEGLSNAIKKRRSHQVSKRVVKDVRDGIASEHAALYRKHCHIRLKSNIHPTAIMDYELLSERIHEFLSRTLPAATLYDSSVTSSNATDVLKDVNVLRELFNHRYNERSYWDNSQPTTIAHHKGVRTNDVTYIHSVLGVHFETDPIALYYSKQIDLIGHIVAEGLSSELRHEVEKTVMTPELLARIFGESRVRSILVEAHRAGPDLKRSKSRYEGRIQ